MGVITQKLRPTKARIIVERCAVIAVIGVVLVAAAVVISGNMQRPGTRGNPVAANVATVAGAVKLYQSDYGVLPPSLIALTAISNGLPGHGPYLEGVDQLLDPWGRPFVLVVPGRKNADFDVVSYGADGYPGGTGEDADIVRP